MPGCGGTAIHGSPNMLHRRAGGPRSWTSHDWHSAHSRSRTRPDGRHCSNRNTPLPCALLHICRPCRPGAWKHGSSTGVNPARCKIGYRRIQTESMWQKRSPREQNHIQGRPSQFDSCPRVQQHCIYSFALFLPRIYKSRKSLAPINAHPFPPRLLLGESTFRRNESTRLQPKRYPILLICHASSTSDAISTAVTARESIRLAGDFISGSSCRTAYPPGRGGHKPKCDESR